MNRQQTEEITALYCRFSQDDGKKDSDSNSIQNQKIYLMDYAKKHHFPNPQFYVDESAIIGLSQNPVQTGGDLALFFLFSAQFSANEGVPA